MVTAMLLGSAIGTTELFNIIKRSYKFRIYPNKEQEIQLKKTIGSCRFVYNWGLARRIDAWTNESRSVNYADGCGALTELKMNPEFLWLNNVSSVTLQQSLKNLETAYANCFKYGTNLPKFKKRKNGGSARFVGNSFCVRGESFYLAKIKVPIKIVWSRDLPSKPSSCTISLNPSGQWFVSFVCEEEINHLTKIDKKIGIDLGIETFVTFSDGTKIKQPDSIRKMRRKLAIAQRNHSRKKIGSKNREKAKLKSTKVHQKIVNIRADFLQKLSTQLIRENQTIAIEDLSVEKMKKKGNRKLARLISEQGWREFLIMLDYKSNWYGRELIVVDKYFPSSQICNSCGKTNKVTLKKRSVKCGCGVTYDRDVNAAQNILAAGMAVTACGVDVRPISNRQLTMKQEVKTY